MFTFQVHFNKNGHSTRQSSTQAVPFTPLGLNTINTAHDFSLSAGTYTVSVSAVNEHGSSEMSSPSEQFVIAGMPSKHTHFTNVRCVYLQILW